MLYPIKCKIWDFLAENNNAFISNQELMALIRLSF